MYTYLDAVNYCIAQVGAAPVTSTEDLLPDVGDAKLRIKEASVGLQKTGWWFNKELFMAIPVDSNGEFPVPANTMKLLTAGSEFYIIRQGKLYDTRLHTFKLGTDSVCVSVILFVEFDDLPAVAQDYVRLVAGKKMIVINLEDYKKAAGEDREIQQALIEIKKDDLEIKKRNVASGPKFWRTRGGARPYQRGGARNPNLPGG